MVKINGARTDMKANRHFTVCEAGGESVQDLSLAPGNVSTRQLRAGHATGGSIKKRDGDSQCMRQLPHGMGTRRSSSVLP